MGHKQSIPPGEARGLGMRGDGRWSRSGEGARVCSEWSKQQVPTGSLVKTQGPAFLSMEELTTSTVVPVTFRDCPEGRGLHRGSAPAYLILKH